MRRRFWGWLLLAGAVALVGGSLVAIARDTRLALTLTRHSDSPWLLGLVATRHRSAHVRLTAVEKGLEGQTLLVQIASNDADGAVRQAALKQLIDPQALAEVARNTEHDTGVVAVERLGEESLRTALGVELAWNARSPAVRRAVVESLIDQTMLAEIAVRDRDAAVAVVAESRLYDDALIAEVGQRSSHPEVHLAAVHALDDQASIAHIAKATSDRDVGETAVWKLTDRALLEEVGEIAKRADVRQAALWELEDRAHIVPSPTGDAGRDGSIEPALGTVRDGGHAPVSDSAELVRLLQAGRLHRYSLAIVREESAPFLDRPGGQVKRRLALGSGVLVAPSDQPLPAARSVAEAERKVGDEAWTLGTDGHLHARAADGNTGWLRSEHCVVVPYEQRVVDSRGYASTFSRPGGDQPASLLGAPGRFDTALGGMERLDGKLLGVVAIQRPDGSGQLDWWLKGHVWQIQREGWLSLDGIELSSDQMLYSRIASWPAWPKEAVRALIQRHDAAGTTFPLYWDPEAGQPVLGHVGGSLALLAAYGLRDVSREAYLAALTELARRPADQESFGGPVAGTALFLRGKYQLQAKRWDEALADLRSVVRRYAGRFRGAGARFPADHDALLWLEQIHLDERKDPGAWQAELDALAASGPSGRAVYRSYREDEITLRLQGALRGPKDGRTPVAEPEVSPIRAKRGLTWGKASHDDRLGIDRVACSGKPALPERHGGAGCNPYKGDTSCSRSLPILCLRGDGMPRPPYAVTCGGASAPGGYYCGWAGGPLNLTAPVRGLEMATAAAADAICRESFGDGWRMAEHHDGLWVRGMGADAFHGDSWPARDGLMSGGWGFYGYGDIAADSRFWVAIDDQAANCWD